MTTLLSADGWTPGMIAQSQLIHKTTVRRHLNDWLNGKKLAPANSGSDSHLSKEKTAELVTYLTNNLLPTLFIDGVHPTQGTKFTYGWMPAGKKAQPVETTGSRTRLNIMGALNLNDIGSIVVREYDSINSLNIARFFLSPSVKPTR